MTSAWLTWNDQWCSTQVKPWLLTRGADAQLQVQAVPTDRPGLVGQDEGALVDAQKALPAQHKVWRLAPRSRPSRPRSTGGPGTCAAPGTPQTPAARRLLSSMLMCCRLTARRCRCFPGWLCSLRVSPPSAQLYRTIHTAVEVI